MKLGLKAKIMLLGSIPAVLVGAVAIFVSCFEVSGLMDEEMISQLKVSAYAGKEYYENMNDEKFYREENGDVKKGDVTITGDFGMVDVIRESGDIYATFFYGDERIVTNVLDDNGNRMIGTKAGDAVIQAVLVGKEDYFSKSVVIGGQEYYGYYVPVKQAGTNEVIGMFFTGDRKGQIDEAIFSVSFSIIAFIIAILIPCIIFTILLASGMVKSLRRSVFSLEKVAQGELDGKTEEKDIKRADEIGDIARASDKLRDTLTQLIGNINNTVDTLFESAKEIETIVGDTLKNTNEINLSIDELSRASMHQASSTESISDYIVKMGDSIKNTIYSVGELSNSASNISKSSENTIVVLNNLDSNNQNVMDSIEKVSEQTMATHEYVEKIQAVLEMIREISEETNMLSLNASIEAARAGEEGRGFAIVAEQIGKLAAQSGGSTVQIEEIIGKLSQNSTKAVETMRQVNEIINSQNIQIKDVLSSYEVVNVNIEKTTNEVGQVNEMSKNIEDAKEQVAELILELCAISEENAQSTEVTHESAEDLIEDMHEMESEVVSLRSLAEDLSSDIKIFKI